ncbi:MAG: hypothetical protein A3J83_02210 [Elusimicrobia bacterium RIFOXYA2_FULL_40_6]|nr:MAG: hypothetical protein A3J83_02210 [Elusimicrobia bacterium RIFOXYA2_FULL_40_6]
MKKYKLAIAVYLCFAFASNLRADISALAFGPDGNLYAVIDNVIKIYSVEGKLQNQIVSSGRPFGIAVDNSGDIFVSETGNGRIQKFNKEIKSVFADKLSIPSGIAVGADSSIYVVDTGNNRIKKYSREGKLILEFEFLNPFSLVLDGEGNLLVTDTGTGEIKKFSPEGAFINKFAPKEVSVRIGNIITDFRGNLIVLDSSRYVKVYDKKGRQLKNFGGKNEFIKPICIAIDKNGNIAVADESKNEIKIYNKEEKLISKISASGKERDFSPGWPCKMAIDKNNNVWVISTMGNCYAKYDIEGKFKEKFGGPGNDASEGVFDTPLGVACDPSGRIFICDTYNHRVQVFDSNNNYLVSLTGLGYPMYIAAGPDGSIYVSNRTTASVKKFNKKLEYVKDFKPENDFSPGDLVTGKAGSVYVINTVKQSVEVFDADGAFKYSFGGYGEENNKFEIPNSITADDTGNIYVYDAGNRKIKKYSPEGKFVSYYKIYSNWGGGSVLAAKGENLYLLSMRGGIKKLPLSELP